MAAPGGDQMINKIKQRLRSRTYLAALAMMALAALEQSSGAISELFPPWILPFWPYLFGVVMLTLREITTTALSEK